jgi:mono/diheme cytochrome c family protein
MLLIKLSLAGFLTMGIMACNSNKQPHATESGDDITQVRTLEKEELAARGHYLLTIGSCHDCHSPKKFTAAGMELDSTRLFSGHPAGTPIAPVDADALKPGNWVQMASDITAFVGPWGISYAANLTPDSATGIGAWSEEVFIKALRTGKHLGQENGRPIMPPMPWQFVGKMTDEDLRAIYTYLRTVPPVNNRVPAPQPPDAVKTKKG